MKKRLFSVALVAAALMMMTSCEEGLNLTGSLTLIPTNASSEQPYADGDTIKFASALSNVKFDTLAVIDTNIGVDTVLYDLDAGTIMIGSVDNIVSADFESLTYPLCAINLRGEEAKTYEISCPVSDIEFFKYLDTSNVNSLITTGVQIGSELGNLFVVAVSEDAFYIGYEGNIKITKFGKDGSTVDGTINDVKCIYATVQQIGEIAKQESVADPLSLFPTITFNGTVSSRRLPLDAVLDALEEK